VSATVSSRDRLGSGARAEVGARQVRSDGVLLVIIIAELVLLYVLLRGSSWAYDDNLFMVLAGKAGLTWDWLTSPIYQHWGIGYQFVYAVLHKLMPIDYRWALAGMLMLLGASMYLLQRIALLLFGWGWRSVLIAAYFGLSIFFAHNLQWLASGLQALPAAFWDLLCLFAYVRFQIDGSRRWIALSAGALAGGLLFYERPAYMLVYIALFRICFLAEDLRPRSLIRDFWSERVLWMALLAVAAVWAVGYHESGAGQGLTSGSVTIGKYLQFFQILWAQTLSPGLLGVTVPAFGLNTAQVLFTVALQLAIVGLVAVSCLRKRSAVRAWAFLVITVLFSGAVVARTRIPFFGPGVANDLRYLTDFAWLTPLAVAFALYPGRTVTPRLVDGTRRLSVARRLPLSAVIALGGFIAYAALVVRTDASLERAWPGHTARAWETTLQSRLPRPEPDHARSVLADAAAPPFIVGSFAAPYNRLSYVVPLYVPDVQIDGVVRGRLLMLDSTGTPRPAVPWVQLGGTSVNSLIASHAVTVTGAATTVHRRSSVCVSTAGTPGQLTLMLNPPPNPLHVPYYLRVGYAVRRDQLLPVFVNSGSGYPLATDRKLQLRRGAGASLLFLDSPMPVRLQVTIPPADNVCINSIQVMTLRPQ
jgi:hypothetical protein